MSIKHDELPVQAGDIMEHHGVKVMVVRATSCEDCYFGGRTYGCPSVLISWCIETNGAFMFTAAEDL